MTLALKRDDLRANLAADNLQRSLQPASSRHPVTLPTGEGEQLSRDAYDGVLSPQQRDWQGDEGPQVSTAPANRSLLRFITCGSVDDGKSTLIGRLLFDSHVLLDDQLDALRRDSKKSAHTGGDIDYSLLLDGLAAEREQGITIDVAYRYFSTPARAFIVADTPGHVQYTRNMATGASTADLAIILVDARKGVLEQTRRHCTIVAMLGVRHIILAVNKMDLVGYSEEKFRDIDQAFRMFALDNSFASLVSIPMSAKLGDNLRGHSANMPWYRGPSLLDVLETVEPEANASHLSARFPVQWVNRAGADFRGFSGTLASGTLRPGDAIRALPSGQTAKVARVVTFSGDLPEAVEGQAPTLVLDREIDVSRGDVIVADDDTAKAGRRWNADLLWMSNIPLEAGRALLLKIGARTVPVRLDTAALSVLDIATGARHTRATLGPNDIASLTVETDAPIVAERYSDNRMLGGFILIDRLTSETVAMGLIKDQASEKLDAARADAGSTGVPMMAKLITKPAETAWRSLAKAVSWRATGSVDTFILAYLFTGHAAVAAAISGTEIITKIALYFVHERVWQRFAPGRVDVAKKDQS